MEEVEVTESADDILPNACEESVKDKYLETCDVEAQVPIKMEEIDLSERTDNILPDSCDESVKDEYSEPCDVESQVTGVNCTDGVSVPVDVGGGKEGNSEETLTRERVSNRLKGTGHRRSAGKQHYAVDGELTKGASSRVSPEQRHIMIDFMEEHPALARNQFCGAQGAGMRQRLWGELCLQLNACPTGPSKSQEKWLKSWHDWKSDVKRKSRRLRRHAIGTGGGPPAVSLALTEVEERLVNVMGRTASVGNEMPLDPLQCQMELETSSPAGSEELGPLILRFPEECHNLPSTSHATTPLPLNSSCPSPLPATSTASGAVPRRLQKKKRRCSGCEERDDEIDSRLAAAAETRAAASEVRATAEAERTVAMQRIADSISQMQETVSKVADEFIKYLQRH